MSINIGKRILVVDDEEPLRKFVGRNLAARGFRVETATNGLEALALFRTMPLDLIILDVMMPHMDGFETCRRIRHTSIIPIIILTALGEESDKVNALNMGADDCLTKPFGVQELLARVHANLRRSSWAHQGRADEVLHYRDLSLDPESLAVICRGEVVKLTQTELKLLHMFMQNAGKILPHRTILGQVWGEAYGNEPEYLRVYVGRLRRKLEQNPSRPEYFVTEHGIGYRFGQ